MAIRDVAAASTEAEMDAEEELEIWAADLSGMLMRTTTLTLPAVVARSSRKQVGSLQPSSDLREAVREAVLASKESMSLERVRLSSMTVAATSTMLSPAPMGENGGRGGGIGGGGERGGGGGGEGKGASEAMGGYGAGTRGGGGAIP